VAGTSFADINQLVLEYVDPMMTFIAEMRAFRYYKDAKAPELERMCSEKKAAEPRHNPYFVGPADRAGSFVLYYIPGTKTVVKEAITVTPQGFRFRGKLFKSTSDLFNWFKKHFAELPQKKMRPPTTQTPHTPATAGAHQQYGYAAANGQYTQGNWSGTWDPAQAAAYAQWQQAHGAQAAAGNDPWATGASGADPWAGSNAAAQWGSSAGAAVASNNAPAADPWATQTSW
jgi:hypothetical protein